MRSGDLAFFCAACPQPGLNLPENWEEDAEDKPWLYARQIISDGNFKLEHMSLKKCSDDVSLSDGLAYTAPVAEFTEYLATADHTQQVGGPLYWSAYAGLIRRLKRSTCNKHKAVNAALSKGKNLDVTGVAATACARHGCVVPCTVVDFQKGERSVQVLCSTFFSVLRFWSRQVHIDFGVVKAFNYGPCPCRCGLHVYDVACQHCKQFWQRIQASNLKLPPDFEMISAVGSWHLSAHIPECFVQFSLNFIEGVGQLGGEIIETLWTPLNKIAGSTRVMTPAHRRETIDEHIRDSNWKKIVGLPSSLRDRWNKAVEGLANSTVAFDALSMARPANEVLRWTAQYETAMMERGNALRVFEVQKAKREWLAHATGKILTKSLVCRAHLVSDKTSDDEQ